MRHLFTQSLVVKRVDFHKDMRRLIVDNGVSCLIHILVGDGAILIQDFIVPFRMARRCDSSLIAIISPFMIKHLAFINITTKVFYLTCIKHFQSITNINAGEQSFLITDSLDDFPTIVLNILVKPNPLRTVIVSVPSHAANAIDSRQMSTVTYFVVPRFACFGIKVIQNREGVCGRVEPIHLVVFLVHKFSPFMPSVNKMLRDDAALMALDNRVAIHEKPLIFRMRAPWVEHIEIPLRVLGSK